MKLKDFDFRLWHKPSKRFVDMSVRGADLRIIPADDDYNMELEIWSGFYDKNGKKIYEGDIVKDKHTSGKVVVVRNTFYILKSEYNNNSNTNNGHIDNDNTLESVEVIGNTHESKE